MGRQCLCAMCCISAPLKAGWFCTYQMVRNSCSQSSAGGEYEISRHPVYFYLLVAECLQGECSTWYFSPLYFSRFSLVANTCSVKHYMYILKIANIVNICSLPFLVSLYTVAHLWVKNCSELLPSSSRPGRFDQPIQASQWLKNFKITNDHFLTKVMGNN